MSAWAEEFAVEMNAKYILLPTDGSATAEAAARVRSAGVAAEELVMEADSPYQGILDAAARYGASMIVMGTHGRGGLVRAVIGSVADRVVRHSDVPVVLVPLKDGE